MWVEDRASGWILSYDANENEEATWGEKTLTEYLETPKKHISRAKIIFTGNEKKNEKSRLDS